MMGIVSESEVQNNGKNGPTIASMSRTPAQPKTTSSQALTHINIIGSASSIYLELHANAKFSNFFTTARKNPRMTKTEKSLRMAGLNKLET